MANGRAMSGGAWVVALFQAVTIDEAEALARAIEADPAVEYAEPNGWMFAHVVPNDTCYPATALDPACLGADGPGFQWALQPPPPAAGGVVAGINAPAAWDITTGSAAITVAVIDTGILPAHPDLSGRTVAGYDMVTSTANNNDGNGRDNDSTDPGDYTTLANQCGAGTGGPFTSSWHGTHTAGTIGASSNNNTGVAGINWVSKVQAIRVLASCGGSFADVADAMVWASGGAVAGTTPNATPSRVMNVSLGANIGAACPAAIQTASNTANGNGSVVVVSAGNNSLTTDTIAPANCGGVITVAALGRGGNRAYYSNFDNNVAPTYVEIAAPGGELISVNNESTAILSTLNAGATVVGAHNYIYYQGTSMSAPHVTGVASLMLSVNDALTPSQLLAKITASARPFPSGVAVVGAARDCTADIALVTTTTKYCGAGMLDARAAVLASVDRDSIGTYDPVNGTFFMRVNNEGGNANLAFAFGPGGTSVPLTGDWNGDGMDTVGIYNPATGTFFLRNSNSAGAANITFGFGPGGAGIVPLRGDWNGDGTDTVGIYNATTGTFFLKNTNAPGAADVTVNFGPGGAGIVPLVGDWDGNGTDTLGIYVQATGAFFLKNSNTPGGADVAFSFGPGGAGWVPIVGDWNDDGTTTVGLYNASTGTYFLRNSNSSGAADKAFSFGPVGFAPLAGDWDALP